MPDLPADILDLVTELESQDPQALVAVLDAYGFYLYASPNHLPAMGYSSAELLDAHLSQIVHRAEHRAAYVLRTISVFYTRPLQFSSRIVSKDGDRINITGTLRHYRDESGARYFITSIKPVQ